MARSNPNKRLSIPCVVRQPGKPEFNGIVRQDLGDRFLVHLPAAGSTVTIAKIYVYPDLGVQHNLDAEISPSKNHSPNSGATPRRPKAQGNAHQDQNLSPSKNLRTKGEGSGSIHCKPIKRNGKEYKQYWYHYELWRSGERLVKKSRYVPQQLLVRR
ncbi:MAG: hypothetical protein AAFR63_18915, partial [Cyanobacteria bacterium J06631_6]